MDPANSTPEAVTPHSLVTEEHVRAALAADKGAAAKLTSWRVVDFTKKGDNYACVVTSVKTEYVMENRAFETDYIVKLNPCREGEMNDYLNDIIFKKEAVFYSKIIPVLNNILKESGMKEINVPKCFHICLEKEKEIIFLEDMRPKGYKMLKCVYGTDEAHASLVVQELAKLHAASVLLQNKESSDDLREQYPCLKENYYHMVVKSDGLLKLFVDGFLFAKKFMKKEKYGNVIGWVDTVASKLTDVFYDQLECGEPKVICHGDCWYNNLLFRYNEEGVPVDAIILDLQMVRYSTPATDLNYFFYTSMTGEMRTANLDVFLSSYYETFTNIIGAAGQKPPLTRKQLSMNIKNKSLLGQVFGFIALPSVVMANSESNDYSKTTDKSLDDMFEVMKEKAVNRFDEDLTLQHRFLSLFDEIQDNIKGNDNE